MLSVDLRSKRGCFGLLGMLALACSGLLSTAEPASAQETKGAQVLFTGVNVFDGVNDHLIEDANVLVEGNAIAEISLDRIDAPGATVVDGAGRTLMPGLIDAHVHTMMSDTPLGVMMSADPLYPALVAGQAATATLMRGFTSVRDLGGPSFGLKRAIDEGVVPGPRIWPSGATISQTSGVLLSFLADE